MANGKASGGVDLDDVDSIDDGTSALIPSPPPGPIGLDAPSGGGTQAPANIAEQVLSFARRQRGRRVGDGQCFALADRALRGAQAKSAADYGTVTPTADYVWGTSVTLAELQPGDIIQFRDYSFTRVVVTRETRQTTTEEITQERPHHTAVVESVDADGAVTVLEQNSPEHSPVTRTQLFFTSGTTTSGNRTMTTTVQGTFRFYRPEAR